MGQVETCISGWAHRGVLTGQGADTPQLASSCSAARDPRKPQPQCRALQARSPEQASLRPPCLFRVQATHVTVFLIAA